MRLKEAEFLREENVEKQEKFGHKIISVPPLLEYVENAIWKAEDEAEVKRLLDASREHERRYFGWEMNRKGITPVGFLYTGLEGFLVGLGLSADEAHARIMQYGLDIVDGIYRAHSTSYDSRKQLERVMRGESSRAAAVEEWSAILGATLARRRAEITTNHSAQEYRRMVSERAQTLPKIKYTVDSNGQIKQEYFIATEPVSATNAPAYSPKNDREAYAQLVTRRIGIVGHPLLRAAMRHAHR
ncbi:MAG: hypothetical protein CO156_00665 [Candidatus Pacebacteria bacterium CG_4_9_14_3_um_filter_40_12]|nr:MAG: hypothetical protein COU64_02090 [Candidatus Pacebacteria bacterium CG10_big_fil_rev_8_21_14_0_10_40_26]PIZ78528.1 MAG: hypothetical protein COY01_04775 [Candidatus Pacebacteria bacterium CG_4_10_14_0_2_um_filter_40_20]PJA69379.1 MAG: hypothetical protein CO156_00665 [Candidatus Pacebacteria bacterium CG_4_9_14_3_um_filter_40_12]PJC41396.1 MAG: hypothetical protein CO041_04650 [Candidatus Pacebacteria bacterium CG_4_9_14_0_2_um_filter_40_15]